MGKWTPDYIDDVLRSKIKNLVSGAIKRSALEAKDEDFPRITYEDFVQDLDTGDSFTTTLVDILVKELAERRTRPRGHDRRYIGSRSAKSLQDLSQRTRDRRDHSLPSFRRHRRDGFSDYPTLPSVEMDTEEDEESFENMLENATSLEGVRLNSEMYEAYGTNEGGVAPRPTIAPALIDATSPPPPPSAIPASFGRSGPWSMANSPSPAHPLYRQPSIRRPFRSARGQDFHDFTTRRRSVARESLLSRESEPSAREPLWGSRSSTSPARRFFPPPSSRHIDAENRLWGSGSRSDSPWGNMPSPPFHGAVPLPAIVPSDSAPSGWDSMPSWTTTFDDDARTPTLPSALHVNDGLTRGPRRIRGFRTNIGLHAGMSLEEMEQARAALSTIAPAGSRTPTPPVFETPMSHIPPSDENTDRERTINEHEGRPLVAEYPTPRASHEPDS